MGESALELKNTDIEKIGEYVRAHIPEWIDYELIKSKTRSDRELDLLERIIRVEEELKSQRELIKFGFEQMEKRFESMQNVMDKRFESMQKQMDERFTQIDKRFNMIQGFLALGFTVISLMIAFIR